MADPLAAHGSIVRCREGHRELGRAATMARSWRMRVRRLGDGGRTGQGRDPQVHGGAEIGVDGMTAELIEFWILLGVLFGTFVLVVVSLRQRAVDARWQRVGTVAALALILKFLLGLVWVRFVLLASPF